MLNVEELKNKKLHPEEKRSTFYIFFECKEIIVARNHFQMQATRFLKIRFPFLKMQK